MAPRITKEDLQKEVCAVQYFCFPGTTLTVCCITMKNGNHVVGESACVSPENFNEDIGCEIAYQKAFDKMWPLLGFRLRDQMMEKDAPPASKAPQDEPVKLGDQVFYYERVADRTSDPMLAVVANVYDQGTVALTVHAPNGTVHARDKVSFMYPDEVPPESLIAYARPKP